MAHAFDSQYHEVYADVNLTYGAQYVKDCGSYAEVLEVEDLASATGGADGLVLITVRSVSLEYSSSFGEALRTVRRALASCGPDTYPWRAIMPEQATRFLEIYRAMASYGCGDVDTELIVEHESDAIHKDERTWTPEETVDGEDGLRALLRERFDVPC
jgi:hypothetical protein